MTWLIQPWKKAHQLLASVIFTGSRAHLFGIVSALADDRQPYGVPRISRIRDDLPRPVPDTSIFLMLADDPPASAVHAGQANNERARIKDRPVPCSTLPSAVAVTREIRLTQYCQFGSLDQRRPGDLLVSRTAIQIAAFQEQIRRDATATPKVQIRHGPTGFMLGADHWH